MAITVVRGDSVAQHSAVPSAAHPIAHTISPLPQDLHDGLIGVALLGFLSFFASSGLFLILTFRIFRWKFISTKRQPLNQFIVLIFNLLLADIQQSLSFLLNVRWLIDNAETSASSVCWAQAFLVQNGDVASGIWCTIIGLHTLASVLYNYKLKPIAFYTTIGLTWAFIYLLAIIHIALHPHNTYVPAGAWCWIDAELQAERLWLHYFWVFVCEFGTVIIYTCLYIGLWARIRSGYYNAQTAAHAKQATRLMALYPAIYVCCTLPLASARMMGMAGWHSSYTRLCVAGAMITSNGFLDVLVYTLTRRISLFSDEPPPESCGIETFSSPFWTSRPNAFGTVTTIEANGVSRDDKYAPSYQKKGFFHQHTASLDPHSRSGSQQSNHASTDELWDTTARNVVRTDTTVDVHSEPVELGNIEALRGHKAAALRPRTISHDERSSYDFETRPKDYAPS